MDTLAQVDETNEVTFFLEKDAVLDIISQICCISSTGSDSTGNSWEVIWRTKSQYLENTLNKYQEQPLLLAPHMPELIDPCTACILTILGDLSLEDRNSMTLGFQVMLYCVNL